MDLSLQDIDGAVESGRKADELENKESIESAKCSPWSALKHYVNFGLIPGFGLFSESYLLFIFNQVGGPFKNYTPWTTCYGSSMDGYTKMASLVGIIVGMIFFSCVADSLGRR
mmetsp:Transcript_13517/g.25859  ORF Transcript_13517/g.25859 Transcript_13517/m.25859 type:complete len:113 (-) Transcript_13517:11-349(-)